MNNKQALSNFFVFSSNFKKFAKTRYLGIYDNNIFILPINHFWKSDDIFETCYKGITKFLQNIVIDQEMLLLCFNNQRGHIDTFSHLDNMCIEIFCGSEADALNTANKFLRTNGPKSGLLAFNFKKDTEPGYIYKPKSNTILPPPPTLKDLFNAKHDFYCVSFFYQ